MLAPILSTMWADQERFGDDLRPFARAAKSWGFAGLEVSHVTSVVQLDSLSMGDSGLPMVSLHAPTPRVALAGGRGNLALNLASLEEEERREAVRHTSRTVEYAVRGGIRTVVVHLGHLTESIPAEARLRELFREGLMFEPVAARARAETQRWRAEALEGHLEAAARSLEELVTVAQGTAVIIGLENRVHYHQLPLPSEARTLLEPYPPDRVGTCFDVGHAVVLERLGLVPMPEMLALLDRAVVCHLHEVDGIHDHRALGGGHLEWAPIAGRLPDQAVRTFEIDPDEPEWAVAKTVEVAGGLGLLGQEGFGGSWRPPARAKPVTGPQRPDPPRGAEH